MEQTIELDLHISEIEKQARRDDVLNQRGLVWPLFDETDAAKCPDLEAKCVDKSDFRNENYILKRNSPVNSLREWYFKQFDVIENDLIHMIARAHNRKCDYYMQDVVDICNDCRQLDAMAIAQGWHINDVFVDSAMARLESRHTYIGGKPDSMGMISRLKYETVEERAKRKAVYEAKETAERASKIEAEKVRRQAWLSEHKKEVVSITA